MKTMVYIGISLEGFIARKDGDISVLVKFENQEVYDSYGEFINKIDTIVIGRGTFEAIWIVKTILLAHQLKVKEAKMVAFLI